MQTRLHSFYETVFSTVVGFVISALVWQFVVNPLWDLNTTIFDNLAITALFTIVSILRGFFIRRLFNWVTHLRKS